MLSRAPAVVLVIAPHPDDEVLGVGGTIARMITEGARVVVAVVTKGGPPLFSEESVAQGREEAARAHALLGVAETIYLDFPAARLDTVPHGDLNAKLCDLVQRLAPGTVFVPYRGDLHRDHQLVFESCLVATRPIGDSYPREVLAYETLSETNWNAACAAAPFAPNVYVDISDHLRTKLAALECYESQLKAFPDERSVEAVRALAALRGATVSVAAAEAFVLVREVLR